MENTTQTKEIRVKDSNATVFANQQDGSITVECYTNWTNTNPTFVRTKTFKSIKAAENFAALFFAGLRRW